MPAQETLRSQHVQQHKTRDLRVRLRATRVVLEHKRTVRYTLAHKPPDHPIDHHQFLIVPHTPQLPEDPMVQVIL